jgi:hypothetical protein
LIELPETALISRQSKFCRQTPGLIPTIRVSPADAARLHASSRTGGVEYVLRIVTFQLGDGECRIPQSARNEMLRFHALTARSIPVAPRSIVLKRGAIVQGGAEGPAAG